MKKAIVCILTAVLCSMMLFSQAALADEAESGTEMYTHRFTFNPEDFPDEINSIELMGEFMFYKSNLTGNTNETGMNDNEELFIPSQYEEVMSPIGRFYAQKMEFDEEEGVYSTELTLPAGRYDYFFAINTNWGDPVTEGPTSFANCIHEDGVERGIADFPDMGAWVVDPSNPPVFSIEAAPQTNSQLELGTSEDCEWISIANEAKKGTVEFKAYTDVNGDEQYVGVYTPVSYDAQAETPYKVLYVSHGGGGNETDWWHQGGLNNIMDNLIDQGRTEPAVVVTMNNSNYSWDGAVIQDNMLNHIIPFIEENYNVSTEAKDRAFCGLSAGSMATCNLLMHAPEAFGYFGGFSGAVRGDGIDLSNEGMRNVVILLGAGEEDMAYSSTEAFMAALDEAGINYVSYFVTGAHDWQCWPRMLTYFADEIIWTE